MLGSPMRRQTSSGSLSTVRLTWKVARPSGDEKSTHHGSRSRAPEAAQERRNRPPATSELRPGSPRQDLPLERTRICDQGFCRSPKTFPAASATVATRMPPPTSLTAPFSVPPSALSSVRDAAMSSVSQ
jgi:hypothetical protein